MSYLIVRPHTLPDGYTLDQCLPPPDYAEGVAPGCFFDFNPPGTNVTTSKHTAMCSNCLHPISAGDEFEVRFCFGEDDGHIADGEDYREHMFVMCLECAKA